MIDLLGYHMVEARISSIDRIRPAKTLQGESLAVDSATAT